MATVLSARPWEEELARLATAHARVRLVARAADPVDLVARLADTDVMVIGSETPWIEPWLFATVSAFGTRSIGIHPRGDAPGARLVAAATVRFADDVPIERLLSAATVLGIRR